MRTELNALENLYEKWVVYNTALKLSKSNNYQKLERIHQGDSDLLTVMFKSDFPFKKIEKLESVDPVLWTHISQKDDH